MLLQLDRKIHDSLIDWDIDIVILKKKKIIVKAFDAGEIIGDDLLIHKLLQNNRRNNREANNKKINARYLNDSTIVAHY